MLSKDILYTTTGTKPCINLDPSIAPFQVTVACTIVGVCSYKMQYSLDGMHIIDANASWFDSTEIPAATAASAVATLISPVSRIRLVIATIGTSIRFQARQSLSVN